VLELTKCLVLVLLCARPVPSANVTYVGINTDVYMLVINGERVNSSPSVELRMALFDCLTDPPGEGCRLLPHHKVFYLPSFDAYVLISQTEVLVGSKLRPPEKAGWNRR
jgi:hypothetical protein